MNYGKKPKLNSPLLKTQSVHQLQTLTNRLAYLIFPISSELLCKYFFLFRQSQPLQAKAQDLVKEFTTQVTKVTDELKAKNPELFSGDAEKLRVSTKNRFMCFIKYSNFFKYLIRSNQFSPFKKNRLLVNVACVPLLTKPQNCAPVCKKLELKSHQKSKQLLIKL